MNKRLLAERNKLLEQTGIDTEKYLTESIMSQITEGLESCIDFTFNLLKPAIVLNIIFITLSIGLGVYYRSLGFGILFFILSLIISLLGGGLMGLRNALTKIVIGVNKIVRCSYSIVKDIYIFWDKKNIGTLPHLPVIVKLAILCIILPVSEKIIIRKLSMLGKPLYWIIEKLAVSITNLLTGSIEKQNAKLQDTYSVQNTSENTTLPAQTKLNKLFEVLDSSYRRIDSFSQTAVKSISIPATILSWLCIVTGSISLLALFIVFNLMF
ncbi:MAG: hypothetical protein ACOYWZ_16505 [Bacillota bacterium]